MEKHKCCLYSYSTYSDFKIKLRNLKVSFKVKKHLPRFTNYPTSSEMQQNHYTFSYDKVKCGKIGVH